MTELVRSQLQILSVMGMGGLAVGLIHEIFNLFIRINSVPRWKGRLIQLISYVVIGFLVSELFYYCDNGKITFVGIGALAAGVWLWKKFFCDILTPIGGCHGKKERRSKPI